VTTGFLSHIITGTSVLNDSLFIQYGGNTGTSTQAQRDAAYMMAEQDAGDYLQTFLVPTTITGSFQWPTVGNRIQLEYKHINTITGLVAIHDTGCDCDTVEVVGCAIIVDSDNAIVDISNCGSGGVLKSSCSGCDCFSGGGRSDRFRIGYTVGLPAGLVAANAKALMGLITIADIALQQITCPETAEGGAGDPSISNFSDSGYSESRQFLKMTTLGGSPRANYAARMLDSLKFKRVLKF